MADIVQAAKWLSRGKKVKRPWRDPPYIIHAWNLDGPLMAGEDIAEFSLEDLLADDWEIAQ